MTAAQLSQAKDSTELGTQTVALHSIVSSFSAVVEQANTVILYIVRKVGRAVQCTGLV